MAETNEQKPDERKVDQQTVDKFEEYKLFVEDTARFTERRQTISNIYVAVNSVLLVAIGLFVKDLGAKGTWALLLPLPLIAAGIFVSHLWEQLILKYQDLVRLRMDTLRKMEEDMPGSVQMYHVEDELYPRDEEGKLRPGKTLSFSLREAQLPKVFQVLYWLFGIGIIIALFIKAG